MKISNTWIKNLKDKKEEQEFQAALLSSRRVLKRLEEIIEQDISACDKAMLDKNNYSKAAWPYKQADGIGEKRAYTKILNLIKIEEV
jgi:hypothetical protein